MFLLQLFDWNRVGKPSPMGEVMVDIPMSVLENPNKAIDWWQEFDGAKYGQVLLKVTFSPSKEPEAPPAPSRKISLQVDVERVTPRFPRNSDDSDTPGRRQSTRVADTERAPQKSPRDAPAPKPEQARPSLRAADSEMASKSIPVNDNGKHEIVPPFSLNIFTFVQRIRTEQGCCASGS